MIKQELPEGWDEVKLKDIIDVRKESGKINQDKYIEIGDINIRNKKYVLKEKKSIKGCKIAKKGDIIISRVRPTRGAVAIIKEESIEVSSAFTILIPKNKILPKYLFYSIAYNNKFYKYLERLQKGSSYPSCRNSDIISYKIIYPKDKKVQEQIVSILERAERLKDYREQANKLADEYLRSVFYEMFGDPIRNEKRWEVKELNNICELITDGSHRTPKLLSEGFPFLTVSNMGEFDFNYENCKKISKEDYDDLVKNKCRPLKGDVLFSKDGTIGKVMRINENKNIVLLSSISILRPKKIVKTIYLEYFMKSNYAIGQALKSRTGSALRRIILKDIKKIKIPVPPIKLQEEFASIVRKVEKLKEYQQESTRKFNELFNSLMQQAFKGELVK